MNWKTIQVLFIALTIFTTMFIITSGEAFQIAPDLPDPATEDIYFRQLGSGTHNYNYYYPGNTALHSWIDIGDVTQEEMDTIEYPVTFIGKQGTNTEVMNTITLSAQVNAITEQESPNARNTVTITVSAKGGYQLRDPQFEHAQWWDSKTYAYFWGTRDVAFTAEMIDGPDSGETHEFRPSTSFIQGYLTDTEVEDPPSDTEKELAIYTAKFAAREGVNAALGEIPGYSAASTVADYSYGAYEILTMDNDGGGAHYDEDKNYGKGLDDPAKVTFYHEHFPMGNIITNEQKDEYDNGRMPVNYTASIELMWEFCDAIFETTESATLRISAKNLVGVVGTHWTGDEDFIIDGAESYVDITIKNGEPTITSELTCDEDHYYTSHYSGTNGVRPIFSGLKITNPAHCTDVVYNVKFSYRPLYGSWSTLAYRDPHHGQTLNTEVILYVHEGWSNKRIDIKYEITTPSRYGGWETITEYKFDFFRVTNNDGAGGGGGGCPYVSVWNGTAYQHDNNILIASEHQEGVVDDNYVLQNTMIPKDGFYSLKIEEFENSEDFFDTFSLYTIDHQEGYSVGVTPDGEYSTYKDPVPPESAYDCAGNDVLEYVSAPDGNSLYMEENTTLILNYGDIGNAQWVHQKLVVRSYGFESYTEPYTMGDGIGTMGLGNHWDPVKTSLYVSIRADGSEWTNVTVLHPRNHASDMVIPLKDVLEEFVPGGIGELEVRILSTQNHSVDFVGLDNSVPTPVKVQEAPLVSAMLNGVEDVTDILLEGNDEMVTIVPGEYIILTFEIPEQNPAPVFAVRYYMLFSRGYYELFEEG